VGLEIGDLRRLDVETWLYTLGATKTDSSGVRREKPLEGLAAPALNVWLPEVPACEGPLFHRLYKDGGFAAAGLSGDQVARIVKCRAALAGVDCDWVAHSLGSGFFTEARKQGVPLDEVMAITEHRSISTVMGNLQVGSLLGSRASQLYPAPTPEDDDKQMPVTE
jgi:integrase